MKDTIDKVSIIGYGNVGSHLVEAFKDCNIEVTHVVTNDKDLSKNSTNETRFTHDFNELPSDQLVIVCVPDDAIADVVACIPISYPVAYTSGSTSLKSLPSRKNIGVFYPLQTFSKETPLNMLSVPIFIEASNEYFSSLLFDLARKISGTVNYANSEERKELHLSAVFVNNFTNHMVYLAKELLNDSSMNFDHLKPLLKETINKLMVQTPFNAQTGPARRGDDKIIEQHLEKLEGNPKEIYRILSKSIRDTYSK